MPKQQVLQITWIVAAASQPYETDVLVWQQGKRMIGEDDLRVYLDKFDKKYWATYKVLDILQKVFYRSVQHFLTMLLQCCILDNPATPMPCSHVLFTRNSHGSGLVCHPVSSQAVCSL